MLFFVTPLFYFYLNGPSIAGYGFWGGKSYEEICADLSSEKKVEFWQKESNRLDCEEKILRNFGSFVTLLFMIAFVVILKKLITWFVTEINLTRQIVLSTPLGVGKSKRHKLFKKTRRIRTVPFRATRSSSTESVVEPIYSQTSSEESTVA